jgi:hypothetical protein
MAAPSQVPVRYPSGVTTEQAFGPLANYGFRNPFFYHEIEDDFDALMSKDGLWTLYNASTGAIANVAGDGGLVTLTTAATNGDTEALQTPFNVFTFTAGKKSFFLTRVQLSDVTASALYVGLVNQNAVPTIANITDGLYFSKASGGTVLNLISVVGSVATTLAIPTAAYTLANATNIDLGWYVDRNQNIYAFVGSQLVGWLPQSGTGGVNAQTGVSLIPIKGPVAAIQQSVTPLTLTTAGMAVTLGLQAGAAAVKTATFDFVMAAKER